MTHVFFIGIALALFACQQAPERHYDVKGTVVAVDPQRKQITVNHEEIPAIWMR